MIEIELINLHIGSDTASYDYSIASEIYSGNAQYITEQIIALMYGYA